MKTLSKFFLAVIIAFLFNSAVLADLLTPTVTNVYFEQNGEPYRRAVDYKVECYGARGDFIEGIIYTYYARCPEYGCSIEEPYLYEGETSFCNLFGESVDGNFMIDKFADKPVTDCKDEESQKVCEIHFNISKTAFSFTESVHDETTGLYAEVEPKDAARPASAKGPLTAVTVLIIFVVLFFVFKGKK